MDRWLCLGLYESSADDKSVSSPDDGEHGEEGEEGEEGKLRDVGDPFEDMELWDMEHLSDGEVYDIMLVVDINSTGEEIWIFDIEERLSDLSEENPYLELFLVIDLPRAILSFSLWW